MRPGVLTPGVHAGSGLPCLFENGSRAPKDTIVLIHPLLRRTGESGRELGGGESVKFVDTFELDRRHLKALEVARRGLA